MNLPKTYNPESEKKWQLYWEKENIYKFDPDDSKRELYVIDTPPPTISGDMHMGHAFMYAQMDFIARYQRMLGKNVFYPFGTDDNGLPTEKLVEKKNNVKSVEMKRSKFIKLCLDTLDEIRPRFVQDWKNIGISCDFSLFYSTINEHCRKISQWSFIDLYKKGRQYRKEAPTIFCTTCRTAIAQVQLEDKVFESTFNDIVFKVKGEKDIIIATTRPELLSSCVAIFVHPDDARYKKYIGKKAIVPIFEQEVPILVDNRADPEKGSGAVMCCTFGDQTDIEWYKAYNLPLRMSIDKKGRMTQLAGKYQGLAIKAAKAEIIQDLKKMGVLLKQKKITHTVNVHDRCNTPIEIINSKQWYVKYLDLKEEFIKRGAEMNWFPKHMRLRLNNWIKGLQWDWCISRQRHFGIPFPVWYCKNCDAEILAREEDLPVDPLEDKPPLNQCSQCGSTEFIPEKDVLDTWPTSSLTPTIAAELVKKSKNYNRLKPMDLRPQGHDIITFWLFNTLVKSHLHFNRKPWKNVMITGWALDPHGKKMSKSKGNVVHPQDMIKKYNADALRYWAAGSKLGDDLPFQEKDLVTGKKTVIKLWNASKFALMHLQDFNDIPHELETIDKWLLTKIQNLIKDCTNYFEQYEYSKAKLAVDNFFWNVFADYYLEMVKDRLYNPDNYPKGAKVSAQFTLYNAVLNILKLFAPIMPHITEEIYQRYFAEKEGKKSIHVSDWPTYNKNFIYKEAEKAGELAVEIIGQARKYKAKHSMSMKDEISLMHIQCTNSQRLLIEEVLADIKTTAKIFELEFDECKTLKIKCVRSR